MNDPLLSGALAIILAGCAVPPQDATSAGEPRLPPVSPNRPTFSDGTSLVPVGHAQLETGYTFTRREQNGSDGDRSNVAEVTARYRVSEAVEARLLWGGYAWSSTDSGTPMASQASKGPRSQLKPQRMARSMLTMSSAISPRRRAE